MNATKIIIAAIISVLGFLYALFAAVMLLWGWSDSGRPWSVTEWTFAIILYSPPFLISLWLAYRCVGSSLKRTAMAELFGLVGCFLFFLTFFYLKEEPRTLLEKETPITETINRIDGVPDLPLHYDAVGTEMSDGKFNPIMFLTTPIPRDGYKKPLLTIDLKSGAPKIKIFRGTNDLANNNYFLGEFEIVNYPKTKQSMQLMLFFSVDEKKRLFLQARDVDETHNTALKLKRLSK